MNREVRPTGKNVELRTLNHIFFQNVEHFNHDALLSYYHRGRQFNFSTQEFKRAVLSLSFFLQKCGLSEGDRVAILSENRPEWHITDFALLLSRLIVVPIYPSLSVPQVKYLLSQSKSSALVISTREQLRRLDSILSDLPSLQWVLSMEDLEEGSFISLNQILEETPDPNWLIKARAYALSTDPESVATIVYTSGTTGLPKGVMLTHANVVFDLEQCLRRLLFERVDQALSILPLCHAFERLLCYGYFQQGIPIAYGDPYDLPELFRHCRPGALGCVPRVLEKIHEAVMQEIDSLPSWKQSISRFLLKTGSTRIEQGVPNHRPRFFSGLLHGIADLLLFRRLRRRLGGRMRHLICGGARLESAVEGFFCDAGLSVIQGYGLTEASPVITLNPLKNIKLGTVGKPLEGVELSFTEEEELLTRGPHVMKGYYNDPTGTKNAFRGDWLLTGDLAKQDAEGYLTITGRKKEILVTSGGKNVSPGPLEEELRRSRFIERAILVGEGRNFLSALIVPNRENLVQYAQNQKIAFRDLQDLLRRASIIDLYQGEIEEQQEEFSEYEKVKKFCFLEETALQDPEIITPTQKVRRSVLEEKYRCRIDEMYGTR